MFLLDAFCTACSYLLPYLHLIFCLLSLGVFLPHSHQLDGLGSSHRTYLTFLTSSKAFCPNIATMWGAAGQGFWVWVWEKMIHLVTMVESKESGHACPCHGSINGLANSASACLLQYKMANFCLPSGSSSEESGTKFQVLNKFVHCILIFFPTQAFMETRQIKVEDSANCVNANSNQKPIQLSKTTVFKLLKVWKTLDSNWNSELQCVTFV